MIYTKGQVHRWEEEAKGIHRHPNGKFKSTKKKVEIKKTKKPMSMKRHINIGLVFLFIAFLFWLASLENKQEFIIPPVALAQEVNYKSIKELKHEVVQHLVELESGGYKVKEGEVFMTFDPSKKDMAQCKKVGGIMNQNCLSYGVLQMKISTIQEWSRLLGDKVPTDTEAIALANDAVKATAFAERVVFEIPGSIWAWSKATQNKQWFDLRISFIRSLEK